VGERYKEGGLDKSTRVSVRSPPPRRTRCASPSPTCHACPTPVTVTINRRSARNTSELSRRISTSIRELGMRTRLGPKATQTCPQSPRPTRKRAYRGRDGRWHVRGARTICGGGRQTMWERARRNHRRCVDGKRTWLSGRHAVRYASSCFPVLAVGQSGRRCPARARRDTIQMSAAITITYNVMRHGC